MGLRDASGFIVAHGIAVGLTIVISSSHIHARSINADSLDIYASAQSIKSDDTLGNSQQTGVGWECSAVGHLLNELRDTIIATAKRLVILHDGVVEWLTQLL